MATLTADQLTAANLLNNPGTALTPNGLYGLVFQRGALDVADQDLLDFLSSSPDITPLGGVLHNGDLIGVAATAKYQPQAKTIGAAFQPYAAGFVPGTSLLANSKVTLEVVTLLAHPEDLGNLFASAIANPAISQSPFDKFLAWLKGLGEWVLWVLLLLIVGFVLFKFF